MLLALAFVLARNVIKLVVERRRGLPFSRFRLKLVGAFLGLTIGPSLLVLVAGTEMIRQTTSRWFSQPVTEVLTSANAIAGTFYRDKEAAVATGDRAGRGVRPRCSAAATSTRSRAVSAPVLTASSAWSRSTGCRDRARPAWFP
jgi:nitrogen fixation/metabolism regulation signal transduction histidine kinase